MQTPRRNIELAIKHLRSNDLLQAESFSLEYIANHPADTEIEKLLGLIYFRKKDFKPAIAYLTSAIDKTPGDIELLNLLGSVYLETCLYAKSIEYFRRALAINPNYIDAKNNLGRLLCDMNRLPEAQKTLLDALSLSPRHTKSHINLGRVYYLQENLQESIQCYQKALAIEENNALAHYNLGVSYNAMGLFQQAMASYMTCLSFDENNNDAELNLGICELTLGQFANGWGHYFQRHRFLKHKETLSTIIPGKNYQGKHLYFCYSQGIGDELFFLRFLPLLKQQEVFITYRCSQELYPLLLTQTQNSFIDRLLTENEKTPTCDYYFTVDDLPLILAMDSPEKIPPSLKFNQPDKQLIDNLMTEFSALPRPFIGITWRAGTQPVITNHSANQNNLSKIFPLDKMIDLFKGLKGTLFVLQRNPMVEEIDQLKNSLEQTVIDTSNYNDDLSKMLALLNILDDSVCVSNTNLHLLAAINRSANVLIPYPPDWRWMDIKTCSPWFPDFKTFRQSKNQSWDVCLQQLKHKLLDLYAVDK